jgi:hypothetical protein
VVSSNFFPQNLVTLNFFLAKTPFYFVVLEFFYGLHLKVFKKKKKQKFIIGDAQFVQVYLLLL